MTTPPSYISGTSSGGFSYSAGESVTVVSGGLAYGMTVNSGGSEYVETGGTASTTTVNYSGFVYVSAGTAYNTTVNSGGEQDVAGGATVSAHIENGGLQSVYAGSSTSTTVYAGGTQDVGSGGREYETYVAGGDHVYSGGVSYNEQVQNGGIEFLTEGGVASNTVIASGGSVILARNVLYDDSFYATSGSAAVTGVYSKGTETITITGEPDAFYDKIVAKGNTRDYYSGSTLVLKEVRKGNKVYDTEYTASGSATYSRTSIAYKSGGIASGLVVQSGGSVVLDGGTVVGLTVSSSGTEIVGGNVTVHSAGGVFDFYISGITVSGSQLGKGVTEIVNAKDTTAFTVVSSGGMEVVSSGGDAKSTTIDGGTLTLETGAKTATAITFTGSGGDLVVEGTKMPGTHISGFAAGDSITLASVAYVSGATAKVAKAGEVTIKDGGKSYNLHIAGAVTGDNFVFGPGAVLTLDTGAMAFIGNAAATPAAPDWRELPPQDAATAIAAVAPASGSASTAYGGLHHGLGEQTPVIAAADLFRHTGPLG